MKVGKNAWNARTILLCRNTPHPVRKVDAADFRQVHDELRLAIFGVSIPDTKKLKNSSTFPQKLGDFFTNPRSAGALDRCKDCRPSGWARCEIERIVQKSF